MVTGATGLIDAEKVVSESSDGAPDTESTPNVGDSRTVLMCTMSSLLNMVPVLLSPTCSGDAVEQPVGADCGTNPLFVEAP